MNEAENGKAGLLRWLLGTVAGLGFLFGALYSRSPVTAGMVMAVLTVLGEFVGVMIFLAFGGLVLREENFSPEEGAKFVGLFGVLGAVSVWGVILYTLD